MKLGTIRHHGVPTVIARIDDQTAALVDVADMEALILEGEAGLDRTRRAIEEARRGIAPTISLLDADWMAPNPRASKILGVPVNNQALNQKLYRPMRSPMFFIKARSALTGHRKAIRLLTRHGRTVPEPEPVIVFGKIGRNVPEERVLEHVFGYTLTNDVTAGGIKTEEDSMAWDLGPDALPQQFAWRKCFGDEDRFQFATWASRSKASDTFAPMGPWLTTRDEIADPNQLMIRGYVNGEKYCEDSTASYCFSVERVLHEASLWFTMEPGDCVHCGTAGKGTARYPKGPPGIPLGDFRDTEVEVEGLGRLFNPIEHVA